MSFDLYFHTKKGRTLPSEEIAAYLTANGCVRDGEHPQWIYENDSTGVYFLIEQQPEAPDPEDIELFESFEGFDNTQFTFSLNFVRPNFFGLEVFPFVERFMSELDLNALDPQSDTEPQVPSKSTADNFYSEWSAANLKVCSVHFDAFELVHFPLDKSNAYWRHNFHKDAMQESLGDEYFVPSLILVRRATTGEPTTIATWTQHIPNVFPPADYFLLMRQRKKLFRTIDEKGLISRATFINTFGDYLEPFEFEGTWVIRPDKAAAVGDLFDSVEFEFPMEGFFGEGVQLEQITNAERSVDQEPLD